jgi:cystathionine gamma-lyase
MSNNHEDLLDNAGFATKAIHYAQEPEKWDSRCVAPPIVLSSTFKLFGSSSNSFEYGRMSNPTRQALEKTLAALENAKYGLCFSSGIGAISTASFLIGNGDHIILSDDIYGGTHRYYGHIAPQNGIESTNVDMTNLDNVSNALRPNTKVYKCPQIRHVTKITHFLDDLARVTDKSNAENH